jgi:hypothetical protein
VSCTILVFTMVRLRGLAGRPTGRFVFSTVMVAVLGLEVARAQPQPTYPAKYNALAALNFEAQVFEIGRAHGVFETILPSFDVNGIYSSEATAVLRDIQLESRSLAEVRRFRGVFLPPDDTMMYLMNLNSESTATRYIASKKSISLDDLNKLKDILADLQLKKRSLSETAAGGLRPVRVHARPMKEEVEQAGFEVWWAFPADADDDSAYVKIPQNSREAFFQFVPGLYSMFTKKGARRGSKTKLPIDSTTFQVDLPIPE